MPQVICTLQNMSGSVSGITFTRDPDSDGPWLSEVVSDEVADLFATIPGYEKQPEPDVAAEPEPSPKPGKRNG